MAVRLTPPAQFEAPPVPGDVRTVCQWVRVRAMRVQTDWTVCWYQGGTNYNSAAYIGFFEDGELEVWSTSAGVVAGTPPGTIVVDEWMFMAAAMEDNQPPLLAWRWESDSSLSTATGTAGIDPVTTIEARFGGDPPVDSQLDGDLAFCRSWDVALSAAELLAESHSETAVRTDDLWGDWPMADVASAETDISGNDRHLTLSGSISTVLPPQIRPPSGAAILSGGGSLAAAGSHGTTGTALLSAGGNLTATGTAEKASISTLDAGGLLVARGQSSATATAVLSGGGVLAAAGGETSTGIAVLTGGGHLTASGASARSGTAALDGGGHLATAGAHPPLPSQYRRPNYRVEMQIGDQATGWVDVTDRLLEQQIQITRGQAEGSSRAQPDSVTFELDNPDGEFTPGNPSSPWWPRLHRGTLTRISLPSHEGDALLNLAGRSDGLITPSDPSLHIPGTIDIRWWGAGIATHSPVLISRWAPGEEAWLLRWFNGFPILTFRDSATSANIHAIGPDFGASFDGLALRGIITPQTGMSSWWTAASIDGPWEHASDESFTPGEISDVDAPLWIGNAEQATESQGSPTPYIGQVYGCQLRDGADGPPVADVDVRPQDRDITGWTDPAGRGWTVTGQAAITRPGRFFGEVAELKPTWPHGDLAARGESRVTVTAAGASRRLSQGASALDSPLTRRITAEAVSDNIISAWTLEDGSESTGFAATQSDVRAGIFGGEVSLASDDTLTSASALPQVSEGQPAAYSVWPNPLPPGVTEWRVDHLVRIDQFPASTPQPMMTILSSGRVERWDVSATSTGAIITGRDGNGNIVTQQAGGAEGQMAGGWVLLTIMARQQDIFTTWWEFGWGNVGGSAYGGSETFGGAVGQPIAVGNWFHAPDGGQSFGPIVVSTGLPYGWLAGDDGGLTGGALIGFDGELATNRIRRLCHEEQVPAMLSGARKSNTRLGPQGQRTLLELLAEAAAADGGMLADRTDTSGIWYRTRRSLYNQSAMQLDAGRGGVGDITHPFEPTFDDQGLANDVTARRDQGSSSRQTDMASVADEGRYDTEITLNVDHDSRLPHQAGWRLHLGTWPGMRYPAVASELSISPQTIAPWMQAQLGDRITVDRLPSQHPTGQAEMLIQQLTETISPTRWTMQASCVPGGPWHVGVVGDAADPDPLLQRLAASGSVLAAPVDESSTAVTVSVGDVAWISTGSHPGQFPLDVIVGGERWTVTGISPVSDGEQTFSVVRAVNGIRKAHLAGAVVQLADPFRLAL